ncbi:hypothetical protein WKI65_43630 [Streptomyces sp. MS1.AVA.3]|uniref:hypothetical protein n=1 Tax=Streptomyces decoyicus TaxID=249567 RepID=UPI0030C02E34
MALTITRQTNRRLELDRIAQLKASSPEMTDAAAYRHLYQAAIGPRFVGTVYRDATGIWEVLEVLFGDGALARRSNSSWLLIERNSFDNRRREHRFGWTAASRVIAQRAASDADAKVFAAEAAGALVANGLAGAAVSA